MRKGRAEGTPGAPDGRRGVSEGAPRHQHPPTPQDAAQVPGLRVCAQEICRIQCRGEVMDGWSAGLCAQTRTGQEERTRPRRSPPSSASDSASRSAGPGAAVQTPGNAAVTRAGWGRSPGATRCARVGGRASPLRARRRSGPTATRTLPANRTAEQPSEAPEMAKCPGTHGAPGVSSAYNASDQ